MPDHTIYEDEGWFKKDPICGLNPKLDYEIGTQYGYDPLNNGWGYL